MTAYFRDVCGHLASLCKLFQDPNLQLDQVGPALGDCIGTIASTYGTVESEGGYRVMVREAAIMPKGTLGGKDGTPVYPVTFLPLLDDPMQNREANRLKQRELMVWHAGLIVTALDERFPDKGIIDAFKCFHPRFYAKVDDLWKAGTLQKHGLLEFQDLLDHFGRERTTSDGRRFMPLIDVEQAIDEFQRFKTFMHSTFKLYAKVSEGDSGELITEYLTLSAFFEEHYGDFTSRFPQICILINIGLVVPITSVPCECGFSTMNHIKNKQRTKLGHVVLDHLMRIALTGPTVAMFKEKLVARVLKMFLGMRKRRAMVSEVAVEAGCFEALFEHEESVVEHNDMNVM
jgi:hypothetical protein